MRSASLYVSPAIARGCGTAAQLLGYDCGDAWAEAVLGAALAEIPEVAELQEKIQYAIKATREKFLAARAQANTPGQAAAANIRAATQ